MTLSDALLLAVNSACAGVLFDRRTNIFVVLLGLLSASAVVVSLVARFA